MSFVNMNSYTFRYLVKTHFSTDASNYCIQNPHEKFDLFVSLSKPQFAGKHQSRERMPRIRLLMIPSKTENFVIFMRANLNHA